MKALLIITPAQGHYSAIFSLIDSLTHLGYLTYISTNIEYESNLKSLGYNTCILNAIPFGLDYDLYGDYSTSQLKEILSERMEFKIYESRKLELENIIENIAPDLVFIDSHNSTDFIPLYRILKKNKCKLFFLQTTLSTSLCWNSPHLTSAYSPDKPVKILIENTLIKANLLKNRFFEWVKFMGFDDKSTIKKKFTQENINKEYALKWTYPNGCTFNSIDTIAVSPIELEFNTTIHDTIYLGTSVKQTSERAINRKGQFKKGLLYVSFGTLNIHKTRIIETYLDTLNEVLCELTNVETIVTVGKNLALFNSNQTRWNQIQLLQYVDQQDILKSCDFFISHGGLNSIKEAIHFNVPMLIYPLEGDQFGNAQKVKYHNLGLTGNIELITKESLKSDLSILINERSKYKSNLQDFNQRISNYNSTEVLLKAINKAKILE
jgi:UDP:flavonoid glycosyltransferase YjiC (YdhE family)